MRNSESLLDLLERISALRVAYCGLVHERVAFENGIAKRRLRETGMEPGVVRVGLCTARVRASQLSCAHTLARHKFGRIIDDAARERVLGAEEATGLAAELERVSHRIHMTDWAKSEAEKAYAVLLESSVDDMDTVMQRRLTDARFQLDGLVRQHAECSNVLAEMHALLLARVNKALQDIGMSCTNSKS
ncbi:hypothetical protein [Noviherbaspirillum malthae]|uniref:hypothetical protein n=1 Tax=Noviherbaspirillum malthae TaxID=1260987 RepID=UPI00188FAF4E|nr:hypothetical protein [Noviherbaspirillum malthae]